jgi:SAM-dependent methyltransferase
VRDHVASNQAFWTGQAPKYAEAGRRAWAEDEVSWGIFSIPEATVGALPDVRGLDCVELGCGTGYVSAWLLRLGAASVVGLDPTAAQLATAQQLQGEFGRPFPLVRADAERAPLRDAAFDLAISEYGAAIWCDPYRWLPEAARLLRPGGRLVFLANAVTLMLCAPDDDSPVQDCLYRPMLGMHRFEWADDEGVEFHLPHGEMLRLLRSLGFEVEDLIELYAPAGAEDRVGFVTAAWGQRWPVEEVWVARRR